MTTLQTARAAEYLALIERRLSNKTFNHALSVAEHMVSYADRAGITAEQAVAAGLLHDLCKPMKGAELLDAARRYGIEPTGLQRSKPTLLHGPVAAAECREELGIDDQDVLDAIYWHTTGRPGWSTVGLALYVGDFSEPLRTIPEAETARGLIWRDGFEAAVRYVVEKKVEYVDKKYTVDPMTAAFSRWIQEEWRP